MVLFTGSYPLKQAISYLAQMLNEDNSINLSFIKEKPDIIKVEVKSRHVSRKTYKCFLHYKTESVGYTGILSYCCDCANGKRYILLDVAFALNFVRFKLNKIILCHQHNILLA